MNNDGAGAEVAAVPGVPSLGEYRHRWQDLHQAHDVDPTRGMLGVYTACIYRLARPIARRRVHPHVVSLFGVVVAAAVPATAGLGKRWSLLAALLGVASGVLDGIDGAVAALTGRATPLGAVIDAVCDRAADLCLVATLVVLGGNAALGVASAAAVFGLEYTRARATGAGLQRVGVVTVAERPTRVIVTTMCCLFYGLHPASGSWAASASLGVLLGLTVVGFGQLWWWLIRHLR